MFWDHLLHVPAGSVGYKSCFLDLRRGPGVGNPPAGAGDMASIPGLGRCPAARES